MADEIDRAQSFEERERAVQIERLRAANRSVAASGGLCVECGDPIPPARLRVVPSATRCVGCQASAEGR